MTDYMVLPDNLPVPEDDGAADHLPGATVPDLSLPTSDGTMVDLAALGAGRTVIYLYPLTGRRGVDLPQGWDAIPGARGCSTEACDFRLQTQRRPLVGPGVRPIRQAIQLRLNGYPHAGLPAHHRCDGRGEFRPRFV